MVDQAQPPRSIKKYVIAGAIGAIALVGILIALSLAAQPPQGQQSPTAIITDDDDATPSIQEGATEGAGEDTPGPSDGGGVPDTNPEPVPDVTPTASIAVSPNPAGAASNIDIEGSGFNGTQKIALAINGNPVETEPREVMTDEAGNFSAKSTLTEGQMGDLEVTAEDASGNEASTTLSVK